jgi:hypothetical protein
MFLLLHNSGVLFSLGFTILMCVILVLVFNALSWRKTKTGNRKYRDVSGSSRSQRRKEQAASGRKRT